MKKITLILFLLLNFIVYSQDKKYLTDRNEAINLIMIKEYDKALVKINSSLKLKENEADSYYIRGNIFQAKNLLEKAKTDYLKAIKLNPNHRDAMAKCAIIYGMQKDMNNFCYYAKKACSLGSQEACDMTKRFCN